MFHVQRLLSPPEGEIVVWSALGGSQVAACVQLRKPDSSVAGTAVHPRTVVDGKLHDTLSYVNTPGVHSTPPCPHPTPPLGKKEMVRSIDLVFSQHHPVYNPGVSSNTLHSTRPLGLDLMPTGGGVRGKRGYCTLYLQV